jgi:hypothetical protein
MPVVSERPDEGGVWAEAEVGPKARARSMSAVNREYVRDDIE